MLLTASGDRAAEGDGEEVLAGAGLAAGAAVRAATIPGARFARGTLRGSPALVVWTEADWSVGAVPSGVAAMAWAPAGAGSGTRGSGARAAAAARPAATRSARSARSVRRSVRPSRRPDRLGRGDPAPGCCSRPDGEAGMNGVAPPGGGPDAPGVRVGRGPVRASAPAAWGLVVGAACSGAVASCGAAVVSGCGIVSARA